VQQSHPGQHHATPYRLYRYEQQAEGCYGWTRILLLAGVLLLLSSAHAGAMTCTTHTYWIDGRYVMCQTCCTNGMCNTTCF